MVTKTCRKLIINALVMEIQLMDANLKNHQGKNGDYRLLQNLEYHELL